MGRDNLASLLLLTDGRLPTGGHAHSGGIEEAVATGRVTDVPSLRGYLVGRLGTAGEVDADFGIAARHWAAAGGSVDDSRELDAELSARVPSPSLRRASRAQGRGLRRAALVCWPSAALDVVGGIHPDGPPWPIALGVAAAAAGLADGEVALAARWASVTGPAWAAVRLLGLDPLAVAGALADLGATMDAVTPCPLDRPSGRGGPPGAAPQDVSLHRLSAASAPLADLGAEDHATWEVRLFAS